MKAFGLVTVFRTLPSRINRLHELAYNLWWSWHPKARELYSGLDPDLWEQVKHNPVRLLCELQPQVLEKASQDPDYLQRYDSMLNEFDEYMHPRPGETWFSRTYPELINHTIAYFSAEFGLDESLPIYSGGLGILSGDHAKEASDLDLPYIGVGMFYAEGYFQQRITRDGLQEAFYDVLHFSEASVLPVYDEKGAEVMICVDLPGRPLYARLWKVQVGRIPLYLMDTDVPHNSESDRKLTARLYGGDIETRISQEILLGIDGVRALRALGITPTAWHLNEGHAAFLNLERCHELVATGLNFYEAREAVEANSLFTTHTPVPAGNDIFGYDLIDKYFWFYWGQLGLTREQFMEIAREDHGSGPSYGMTVLALRLTGQHNGVSKLHGAVARNMWQFLWPNLDVDEVPIDSVTNGVHSPSWVAPEMDALYKRYVDAEWKERVDEPELWNKLHAVPDDELWRIHRQRKALLIDYTRQRLRRKYLRQGASPGQSNEFEHVLNPDALTIGFARRFATYKRATLILRDLDRLGRILNKPERPVQIIFAGKAHPADEPGKALVEQVYHLSRSDEFRGTIVFLENYDIEMARYLVYPISLDTGLADIRDLAIQGNFPETAHKGSITHRDATDDYIKHALTYIDVSKIRPLKVVVDASNGMAGMVMPRVFEHLPAHLYPLYFELDGTFPNHSPSPIEPENLVALQQKVLEVGADFGAAFDGDADRMFPVDEKGNIVDGSMVMLLVSNSILRKYPGSTILYNLILSKSVPALIERDGGKAIRTRVGHSYIKAEMRKDNAIFGGEHSGHFYFRDNWYADSGLIALLLILELISIENKPLSELIKPLDTWVRSGEINTPVKDVQGKLKAIEDHFSKNALSVDHLDGVTIDYGDWWFNVRPSNTEPLLRLNVEAKTRPLVEQKRDEMVRFIRE